MGKKKEKGRSSVGRETNMLLSQNVKLTFDTWKTRLGSMNCLLIGGTGEGKSRNVIKPNIWSLPTDSKTGLPMSLVFTDPKGELCEDTAEFLRKHGYKIRLFNINDMRHSDCYNPFKYITDDNSLMIMIDALVTNGNGESKDPFWNNQAKSLINSIAFYMFYEFKFEEQNFSTLADLLNKAARDGSSRGKQSSEYEKLLDTLEQRSPMGASHPAIKWFNKVKASPDQTYGSIMSTAQGAVRLFASKDVQRLTDTDTLQLDMIGDEPTALYIITSTTNSTYDFLISLMYTQLFESLLYRANTVYADKGHSLPHHIVFWMDEFANVGQIPDFDKKIAVFRQANISSVIVVQTPNQIESIYEGKADNIIGNNHIVIFLGSGGLGDKSAPEWMSKALGNKTIQVESTSVDPGQGGGLIFMDTKKVSHSYAAQQRALMLPDEIRLLSGDKCLILIKGYKPFIDKKIAPESCLNYEEAKNCKFSITDSISTSESYLQGMAEAEQVNQAIQERRKLEIVEDARYVGEKDTSEIGRYVNLAELPSDTKKVDVERSVAYNPMHEWELPEEMGKAEKIILIEEEEEEIGETEAVAEVEAITAESDTDEDEDYDSL